MGYHLVLVLAVMLVALCVGFALGWLLEPWLRRKVEIEADDDVHVQAIARLQAELHALRREHEDCRAKLRQTRELLEKLRGGGRGLRSVK